MIEAAVKGDTEMILCLLSKGAPLNPQAKNGFTPLMWAIERQHRNTIDVLLNSG